MQIRRQSDPEFEAFKFTGSYDLLISWLANQTDFAYATINHDLTVVVARSSASGGINLSSGDYIRIKEDNTLDKISASNFSAAWEPVIPAP